MGRARPPLTSRRLVQGKGNFLELGAGEFKVRAEVPTSTRGAGAAIRSGCSAPPGSAKKTAMPQGSADTEGLQSATAVLQRATAAPWRASGQPPPPSAPRPVWGWRAGPLSRGCGGRGFARINGAGECPQFPRAAGWSFSPESGGLAYQLSSPPVHGRALCRSIALQRLCRFYSAFVLIE